MLGEAVSLSQEFCEQNSENPWASIAGKRDRDGINTQRLWLTVKISIPEFLIALEAFLPQEGE